MACLWRDRVSSVYSIRDYGDRKRWRAVIAYDFRHSTFDDDHDDDVVVDDNDDDDTVSQLLNESKENINYAWVTSLVCSNDTPTVKTLNTSLGHRKDSPTTDCLNFKELIMSASHNFDYLK